MMLPIGPGRAPTGFAASLCMRPELPGDAAPLHGLRCAVRAQDFALLGLAPEPLRALCAQQVDSQWRQYRMRFTDLQCEVVEQGGALVGAMAWRLEQGQAPALHLVDIVVHPQAQGHGLGSAMLQQLLGRATDEGLALRLEVLRQSPARAWYVRRGFVPTGGAGNGLYEALVRPAGAPVPPA